MTNPSYTVKQQEAEVELDLEHWLQGSHLEDKKKDFFEERRTDGLLEAKFNVYRQGAYVPFFVQFYASNDQIFLIEQESHESELDEEPADNRPLLAERVSQEILSRDEEFKARLINILRDYFFPK